MTGQLGGPPRGAIGLGIELSIVAARPEPWHGQALQRRYAAFLPGFAKADRAGDPVCGLP